MNKKEMESARTREENSIEVPDERAPIAVNIPGVQTHVEFPPVVVGAGYTRLLGYMSAEQGYSRREIPEEDWPEGLRLQ